MPVGGSSLNSGSISSFETDLIAFVSDNLETYLQPPALGGRKFLQASGVLPPLYMYKVNDLSIDDTLYPGYGRIFSVDIQIDSVATSNGDSSIMADRLFALLHDYSGVMGGSIILSSEQVHRSSSYELSEEAGNPGVYIVVSEFSIDYLST